MLIEKKIKDYFVFSGDKIIDVMKRINKNKSRIVFVVKENGILIGSASDGDVRRWIIENSEFDLDIPVDRIMNTNPTTCRYTDNYDKIKNKFSHSIDIIPLLDTSGRFIAIARKGIDGLHIGEHIITKDSPSFIIAEIGNNHQGDKTLAKKLVDMAIEAGADCVKFQIRYLKDLYRDKAGNVDAGLDLGSEYTMDLLHKFQLSSNDLFEVFDYSRKKGILPLCTPWDLTSFKRLEEFNMPAYKVASADFTNYELLEAIAKSGKPMICSTGMCKEWEIKKSTHFLQNLGAQFALLHCNSTYPTPFKDVNLKYIQRLKKITGAIVGYSGHERGYSVPVAAVAMGAKIIEKHFTIDRSLEGTDHKVSLLPEEFTSMVSAIREIEMAMGKDGERDITQGEMINRENLAKSLVAAKVIKKGQKITRDLLSIKSPGQGIQPNRIDDLLGKIAVRDFARGDYFYESDIKEKPAKKSKYQFSRPFGVPTRYHDFATIIQDVNLDFIEFHLSYRDLDIDPSKYITGKQDIGFAVHCPELFAGDHLLDLSSSDNAYRERSIHELKRVVELTRALNVFFPKTINPVIIVNAGGWSQKDFLPVKDRKRLYEITAESLSKIDLSDVQIAIQTMPPFPWHFGGQSHHNLFVDPNEICSFCTQTKHKICLDISHSMMACNYYHWDFEIFLKDVLPHTVHLHIVDAKGIDGEGVQIGKGDVDFVMLKKLLDTYAPGVQFIPEVWQGHKNNGEGFWLALNFLENIGI
jgi:N-acetylneuraminate synthase